MSAWRKRSGSRGEQAKALAAKPQHVPECRLSGPQRTRLKRLLRAGPRCVAQLVELEFGVSYHPSHLGRLLHTRGFSCQKPVRRSREQGPAAVQAWREQK
ncbi:helix-turn-helix domain-containing protein [Pirellulimonas nuda]|uniref:helix-turn-helix domain-containing protein n=1 Tax=Pirellulimonas nuda TaxID=2528009 RepID=UPI00370446E8